MSLTSQNNTEEWKIVTRKSKKSIPKRKKTSQDANKLSHAQHIAQSETSKTGSVDRIVIDKSLALIETLRAKWAESSEGQRLEKLVSQSVAKTQTVKNAIIAGLGSMDPDSIRDRMRACWQVAVFLEIVQTLSHACESSEKMPIERTKVPMYAQDPVFTAFDKAILKELDIELPPGDGAMERCTQSSFLFVPFVDAVVLLPEILAGRNPLLYAGSDIEEVMERIAMAGYAQQTEREQELVEQSLVIAKSFVRQRTRLAFDFNSFGELALHGMAFYVQNDEQDGG